ncbi:YdcF family protein [Blastopirellula marina]|uniref:DUF218 domain-containing protein n=1 Tax=Blastopirellula marina TaxID=124 RepID=A0A2S8G1Q0_9BACT|nr:YdcF family protein [Blastopirellula marina]PQO38054.1 hypothetical protein C5Y98_08190 [Blastopirellula marina]PTL44710.1 YdcF family protein [Blastopirellula marina]
MKFLTAAKPWLQRAGIAIAVIALLYAARNPLLRAASHWLDVGQAPTKADYVFVLPGNEQTRPFVAAALIKKQYADGVLIPSNQITTEVFAGLEMPAQEKIKRAIVARGVEESKITLLDSATTSTWSDAKALAKFLSSHPDSTVLVVTDHFHTRRARWVFQQVAPNITSQLLYVSAPTDGWNQDDWWHSKAGIRYVTTEYLKLAFYLLRYGDLTTWLVILTVTLAFAFWRLGRFRTSKRHPADETTASTVAPEEPNSISKNLTPGC